MLPPPMLSATLQILITFGVGFMAVIAICLAVFATLQGDDRAGFVTMLRHPLRTVFSEHDHADEDR